MDLDDIDRADALVLMTMPVGTMFSSGGRMVELGYAIGTGKRIFILGPRENIFCHLPRVIQCETVDDLLYVLGCMS
jgi:nucleoside 2-deoxyribosyltransferase